MTGVGDDSRGRFPGAPALVVGVTLAAGATLALVFTEDLRWLRLAIVAALWAALIGAFVAVRYRKQAAATEESVAQAQAVYELELEREIAARREFELEIESDTRDRVEADSRDELEALRNEVTALRESLQSLFGGEVLYERVALTAQSTRMRSLNDEPKVVAAGESNGKTKAQLTSGKPVEHPTEMMAKVREDEPAYGVARRTPPKQAKPPVSTGQGGPQAPAPTRTPQQPPQRDKRPPQVPQVPRAPRPPQDSGPPTRRVAFNEPVDPATAKAAKAASEARGEPGRAQQPDDGTVAGMRPVSPQKSQRQPKPQQPSPPHRASPPAAAQRRPEPPQAPERHTPGRQREPEQHELTRPAMDRIARGKPAAGIVPPEPPRTRPPEPAPEPKPKFDFEWMSAWTDENRGAEVGNAAGADSAEAGVNGHGGGEPEPVPEAGPAPEVPEPNPTLPESARELQRSSRPGGRRRRDDADDEPAQSSGASRHGADEGGGRRRRAEGEPQWQGLGERERSQDSRHSSGGSHSLDDPGGHAVTGDNNGSNGHGGHNGQGVPGDHEVGTPTSGRRAADSRERSEPESGSHAEGRSVSDLLAAHGSGSATPRRRRRVED